MSNSSQMPSTQPPKQTIGSFLGKFFLFLLCKSNYILLQTIWKISSNNLYKKWRKTIYDHDITIIIIIITITKSRSIGHMWQFKMSSSCWGAFPRWWALDDVVKPLSLGMPHLGALSYLVEHSKVFFFVFGSTSSPPPSPLPPPHVIFNANKVQRR